VAVLTDDTQRAASEIVRLMFCRVAEPDFGKILLVRCRADGTVDVSTLIDGLRRPQGMALHPSNDGLYLYVGESNQVSRYRDDFDLPDGEGYDNEVSREFPLFTRPGAFFENLKRLFTRWWTGLTVVAPKLRKLIKGQFYDVAHDIGDGQLLLVEKLKMTAITLRSH
jgi:hypothetical protein